MWEGGEIGTTDFLGTIIGRIAKRTLPKIPLSVHHLLSYYWMMERRIISSIQVF